MVGAFERVDDERLVGDSREEGARLDERADVLHLRGARPVDGVGPEDERAVDGLLAGGIHLPDGMMAVGVAERARENMPIGALADVGVERVAVLFRRAETERVVLVERLAVEHGLLRRALVVVGYFLPGGFLRGIGRLRAVAGLLHVEIEPCVGVKPGR